MARATQGLQIALIVSVMLNVVLGVTTYLYNKQAFEKTNAALQAAKDKQTADAARAAAEEKSDQKGKIIGLADLDIDQLNKKLYERQQEVGLAPKAAGDADVKPTGGPGYDKIVEQLCAIRDARTNELKNAQHEVEVLKASLQNLEAASQKAVGEFAVGVAEQKKYNETINTGYQARTQEMATTEAVAIKTAKEDGERANAALSQAKAEAAAARKAVAAAQGEIKPLIETIRKNERQDPDPPSGEITYVSLPTKTVWIDKGRADYLPERIRFTVYAAESNMAAKAVAKGTVEVTRVLDDHRAECRIVDDKSDDPITAGDKVFTAFWLPGQQKHFAFSGIMNLDGDSHNQVKAAIALVKNYGGVVDCWLDEHGGKQGVITANTEYIVHGDDPRTSSADTVRNNTEIERDAARYQLHPWSLADFKQKLNYQKTSSLERFGAGASSDNSGPATAPTKAPAKAAKAAPASKAEDEFK